MRTHWTAMIAGASALVLAGCAATAQDAPRAASDDPWLADAEAALAARLARTPNHARARNVIVFIADGAGPAMWTAARIHDGQLQGEIGDMHEAPIDTFPHTALARVYSPGARIPDSASTASALFTGVKTHVGGVSVPEGARSCADVLARAPQNLAELALESGRRVGVISTSGIVDATPAAFYGHGPTRGWADPGALTAEDRAAGCRDLPEQLVGAGLHVMLGGGRDWFLPPAGDGERGRADGRDLVAEWSAGGPGRAYVADGAALAGVDSDNVDALLGLLARGVMFLDEPVTPTTSPTLAEMTRAAIDVLDNGDDGFVLMVEHEGTDEFQHAGQLHRALDSAVELFDAVRVALEMVDPAETLIIVTADHGQSTEFGGPATLDDPITGLARGWEGEIARAADGAPFAQMGFYTGPRGRAADPNLTQEDVGALDYVGEAAVALGYVMHSATDIPVYAMGPWSDLFAGTMEQNAVFVFIRHAMETGG